MATIYTGTAEELASDDNLMAELIRLDRTRNDLDGYSDSELMAYIITGTATLSRLAEGISAAAAKLAER